MNPPPPPHPPSPNYTFLYIWDVLSFYPSPFNVGIIVPLIASRKTPSHVRAQWFGTDVGVGERETFFLLILSISFLFFTFCLFISLFSSFG